jgi:ribosomal protein S18 acetylase RimI-like enzyme
MPLRRATHADLPALLILLDLYYTEWHVQQRDNPTQTLAALQHPTLGFLVAEDELTHQLTACVLLRELAAHPNAAHSNPAECKRLYVLPTHRGRGLAHLLMDAAEAQARAAGFTHIYLDSAADFTAALALYRRRGYREVPRFNDNPQATVFLQKPLS